MTQELPFKMLLTLPHQPGGWEAAGATSSRSSPRPLSPSSPATAGACQRPEGFPLQPGPCCRALTKCQGWFGGEHREGLAIARLFMKACFLGGASYRFCCHLPQRCTEKKNGKIVNYGKQHFTAFIIFRIIGINRLMGTRGNVGAGGNGVLCPGVQEWGCGTRQAIKISPETPFQNLVVEKTPGAILTLCLVGRIPELIIKVFKHKKKCRTLAAHVKTHFLQGKVQSFHSDRKCPPDPGPGKSLTRLSDRKCG